MIELNSFLEVNYEFNNKTFNLNRGHYYMRIEEQPSGKIEKLNELDSKFELLILDIDNAILNKKNNINKVILEYNNILNEVKKIVNLNKDYLIADFDSIIKTKTYSNKFRLNAIKNRLVIAMSYAFEYASRKRYAIDRLISVKIDTETTYQDKNSVKITLLSEHLQKTREKGHIIIDKFQLNNFDQIDNKVNSIESDSTLEKTEFDWVELTGITTDGGGILKVWRNEKQIYKIVEEIGLSYGRITTTIYMNNRTPIKIIEIEENFEQNNDGLNYEVLNEVYRETIYVSDWKND